MLEEETPIIVRIISTKTNLNIVVLYIIYLFMFFWGGPGHIHVQTKMGSWKLEFWDPGS